MKPLIFEIPAVHGESIVVQEDQLPNFYNRFHKHEQIQITAIIAGKGVLNTKSGFTKFEPGQIFILGSNQPHFFKSTNGYTNKQNEDAIHAIHVYFKNEVIGNNFNLPEFEEAIRFVIRIGMGQTLHKKYADASMQRIKNIAACNGSKRIFELLEFLRYCYYNLEKFTRLNSSEKESENFFYNNKARVNDIYAYTMAHFEEDICLGDIAKVANMTVPAMCKHFKKSTRKTYMEFLKEVRIDYACKRIISRDYQTIADIAYSVGFKNATTFNRAFKSQTGKSPTDYLNEHRMMIKEARQSSSLEQYLVFQ